MEELQEIDVEQVMERIRENIRRRRAGEESLPLSQQIGAGSARMTSQIRQSERQPLQPDHQLTADLTALGSSCDVYHVHFTSHRKFIGSFVVLAKKILRKLLTPILERQVAYNATNARIAAQMYEALETVRQHQQLQRKQGERQSKELQSVVDQQGKTTEDIAELRVQLREMVQRLQNEVLTGPAQAVEAVEKRVSGAERKLRRILYLLRNGEAAGEGLTPSSRAEGTTTLPGTDQAETIGVPLQVLKPDFDYFAFEERFRGTEVDIKERQRNYVEYFRGRGDVLDIGCGRGEFLELLKEAGITAKGVELDLDMTLYCQDKGLDVVRTDAFSHLEALSDESLGGIFAAQVIEHLESSQIIRLVKLSHRKLRKEGVLILETLNPESLFVQYRWFWMDLTHTRLIHPETLKFLFESIGFDEVMTRFLPPPEGPLAIPPLKVNDHHAEELRRFNEATEYLNRLLYGSSDYAVIGKK